MNILVINCGSSSLKFQLIDMTTEAVQAKGLCERIGIDGSRIVYTPAGGEKMTIESPMPTHTEAIKLVLDCLTNAEYGVIKSLKEINAVGHRVVHGGEKFASSTIITDEVIKVIEECNELAPLHNPANLIGINVCRELMPGVPMVGVFDTAFHQTMLCRSKLTQTTRSEDTVSTEHLTASYPRELLNSLVSQLKILRQLFATLATVQVSVQLTAASL